MSGVATAVVAGSYLTSRENRKASEAAADARPQYPEIIEPAINRQLSRTNSGNRNISPYTGPRVAEFSPFQMQGFSLADSTSGRLGDQADLANQGFQSFASGERVGNNPFLEDAIGGMRETAFRDLTRNQLPAVRNTAIATGGLGDTRQGIAEGLALSDMNRDLLNREAAMRSQQFNIDQNQMLQALMNQGQILSGQTAAPDFLQRVGALDQQQSQALLAADQAQFEEGQNLQFQRDQELLRILLGAPAAMPAQATTTNPLVAGIGTGLAVSQLFPQQNPATTVNVGSGATNTFNPAGPFYLQP